MMILINVYSYTRFFFIRNQFIRNLILDMPNFKKLLELNLKCQFKNKKLLKLKYNEFRNIFLFLGFVPCLFEDKSEDII